MAKVLVSDLKVLIKKLGQRTTIGFLNMGSITNLKTNKTLFIPCGCRNEVLLIEYDHEWKIADLAIYETDTAFRTKMSLWQRLRYCWQILWYKKSYADQITLDNTQLLDLKNFLNSLDLAYLPFK
jgi:hypothetical protein